MGFFYYSSRRIEKSEMPFSLAQTGRGAVKETRGRFRRLDRGYRGLNSRKYDDLVDLGTFRALYLARSR